jgi:hypothetical protein
MSIVARHNVLIASGVIVAAPTVDDLVLMTAGIFLLLYVGVVLPAVFFRDAVRRRDARMVLQQILDLIRRPRSP